MKALNERIFRMASFSSLALTVLEICTIKAQKTSHFLRKILPYEISKSGDKISDLGVFKISF